MPLTPSEILNELAQIKYDLSVTQTRVVKVIEHLMALDLPDTGRGGREFRAYDPPADPNIAIRRMIANGVIADALALDVEIRALGIEGDEASSLRALLAPGGREAVNSL